MKLKEWEKLIFCASKILDFDENNSKAAYRKAFGLKEKGDLE